MQGRLQDRVIVVTGGSSGIGRAIVGRCVQEGARVVISGRQGGPLEKTVDELGREYVHAVRADARDPGAAEHVVSEALDRFGRLDGAVANAGRGGAYPKFIDLTSEDWEAAITHNLSSSFYTLQSAARVLTEQGTEGSLVAVGSSRALRLRPGFLPYAIAKGAVHLMAQGIAVELAAHRIRCNAIIPGLTETPATRASPTFDEQVRTLPMGEVIQPEEIAALASFLLSDEAHHVSGALLVVDGARTLAS